ncbi:MAG: MBL fold metallo-hydrolase, partial [Candidatus Atribacteria bacterium]|nr:MBL fold metallo-hydrolase [Candidatus Atribacteria bacterium]
MMSGKVEVIPVSLGMVKVFFIRGTCTILVDTGLPGKEKVILERMNQEGIDPRDISLILLTHGHHDHCGSAYRIVRATGAPVAIHQNDASLLEKGKSLPIYPTTPVAHLLARIIRRNSNFPPFKPDLLIDGELNLAPFGVNGRVIETPGH